MAEKNDFLKNFYYKKTPIVAPFFQILILAQNDSKKHLKCSVQTILNP